MRTVDEALMPARSPAERSIVAVTRDVPAAAWDEYVRRHAAATRYHMSAWRGIFERAFGHETIYLAARREADGGRGVEGGGQKSEGGGRKSIDTAGVEQGSSLAQGEQDCSAASMEQGFSPARIVGVLPLVSFRSLLFGRFLVSLPFVNYGGVLADDEAAERALLDAAREEMRERGAAFAELRHTRRVFPELPARQHKVAMTLPLPGDAETAWRGFDNKIRNQVRKAEKSGLQAVSGGAELVGEFYEVFARNMRDLGTPVYSRRLFEEVAASAPATRVFVVRLEGSPVAAGITIGFGDAVENPWASSLREHRPLNPNMLLYWAMIQDAISAGYRVFDFGRSTPDEGTYHFKKQWGAVESPFYWEYVLREGAPLPDHNPKSDKFHAAVSAWQRLPLSVANILGPHIVRNIP